MLGNCGTQPPDEELLDELGSPLEDELDDGKPLELLDELGNPLEDELDDGKPLELLDELGSGPPPLELDELSDAEEELDEGSPLELLDDSLADDEEDCGKELLELELIDMKDLVPRL